MPIQTNCAQAIRLFHVPLPGSDRDVARLRAAFKKQELRNAKLAFLFAKDPLVHGRIYVGGRIMFQIAKPFPLEVLDERFWKEVGKLIARTKEPWWDFCEITTDWKPKKYHPHAHALSIWRVTRKGELRYLSLDDPSMVYG
jgi:hypothetical protein